MATNGLPPNAETDVSLAVGVEPSGPRRPRLNQQVQTRWYTWIWLLPVLTILPYWLGKVHYALPAALAPYDANGRAQPSETRIMTHVKALEDIGYRTVGTTEAILGEEYVLDQARALEAQCNKGGVLECQVWEQIGSGYHSFTIADHDVLKLYSGVRNVIMRISAKQGLRGEKDAVMLGSHIDSTISAPGAADDGLGVGVMLDLARVMIERNEPFNGSVIFVWNGAEETLQDGSHLYATQHETAKTVRAVINLEAAGTTGGALVFQATSKEMIEAYAHVPHPHGTAIASEVFASGIMISDTDFGQYERYLGVSGLDMALVGHSYFYHTRHDSLPNISPGSAQHFGSNIQSVLDHLLGPDSPLVAEGDWHPPDLVYVSLFDKVFFKWSMATADKAYPTLALGILALTVPTSKRTAKALGVAVLATPLGMVAGLVAVNVWAASMGLAGLKQTWFINEHLPLVLYAPVGLQAYLSAQYGLSHLLPPLDRSLLEHAHYHAQLIYPTLLMLVLQALRLRSAYVMGFIAAIQFLGVLGHQIAGLAGRAQTRRGISVGWGYAVPIALMVALGIEAVTSTLDIFTPLTGRMGKAAPAEHIIATICAVLAFTFLPHASPLFHRLSRRNQRQVLLGLLAVSALSTVVLAGFVPRYDTRHPKRVAIQYSHNHTSNADAFRLAFLDSGNDLGLLSAIHGRYGSLDHPPHPKPLTEYTADWDVIYPISVFLDGFEFDLPSAGAATETVGAGSSEAGFQWPEMGREVTSVIEGDQRRVQLTLNFTGLVWPTIAFEAEILDWSFDFPPPTGKKRHHIKIVTTKLEPVVKLELVLRETDAVMMDWTAVDGNQMVPWTAPRLGPSMPASKLLLDLDQWAETKWNKALDIVAAGIVSGAVEI